MDKIPHHIQSIEGNKHQSTCWSPMKDRRHAMWDFKDFNKGHEILLKLDLRG